MRIIAPRAVNEIEHVGSFIRKWSGGAPPNTPIMRSKLSEKGNINLCGTVGASRSALLAPSESDFISSIEPGVRELVGMFVSLGAVTYTSCEGHRYDHDYYDELHVGILVRNDDDARRLENIWYSIEDVIQPPFELGIMRHTVVSGRFTLRALDLYVLRGEGQSVDEYFDSLDQVCNTITEAVYTKGFGAPNA